MLRLDPAFNADLPESKRWLKEYGARENEAFRKYPVPSSERERRRALETATKFLVVRHPVDRLVSSYLDKVRQPGGSDTASQPDCFRLPTPVRNQTFSSTAMSRTPSWRTQEENQSLESSRPSQSSSTTSLRRRRGWSVPGTGRAL